MIITRKITLKVLGKEGEVGNLDYKVMLKSLLQFPQADKGGFSVDEIRTRSRILDALDKADTALLLEEADYLVVKHAVDTAKYGMAHANLVSFIEDVDKAEALKVEPVKATN